MARYLSSEWLDRLPGPPGRPSGPGTTVIRHVVTDPPGAALAAYDLVVADGTTTLRQSSDRPADVTFSSDYETAATIASGHLSTQAALAAGRIKVTGNLTVLASLAASLGRVDPLPADLRAETEFVP